MQGFKPKTAHRKGYANGGMVRGPGTGTSDDIEDEIAPGTFIMPADSTKAVGEDRLSKMGGGGAMGFAPDGGKVPVNLSNGEFKLPPEQVHAVGVQALKQMKDATHTPAPQGFAPAVDGVREARVFLREGGTPEEERARLANQTAMYVQGAQQNAATAAAAAPPPPAPLAERVAQIPTGGLTAPPATASAVPTPGVQTPSRFEGTRAVVSGAADDARAAWNAGNTSGALGAAVRGALTAPAVAVGEAAYGAVAPVARAAQGFYGGLTGQSQTAPAVPAQQPATPAAAAAPATPAPSTTANPTDMRLASGAQAAQPAPTAATGSTQAQPAGQSPQATQIASGVFRSGNSYGDSPAAAAGFAPAGAQPSAQNMLAADNLAATSAARGFSPGAAPQAPGVAAPTVRTSANDWQTRKDIENLRTSAMSITNNGGRFDRTRGNNPAQAEFRAALGADAAARGAQATGDVATMQANAGLQREQVQQAGGIQREQIQQTGASGRAAAGFNVDRERLGIDRSRVASENTARDVTTQGAQQLQQLRNVLLDPKATPEQRKQAEASIRAIGGKAETANRYTVVPGGQEVSPQGIAYTRPSQVIDNQTGQFVQQGAAQPAQQAAPVTGQVYTDAKGNRAKWDGTKYVPA